METLSQIIDSMTAIGMIVAVVASFLVVLTAGIQALRMRDVRWDALLFILVILWAIPIGLRNYGPQLMDASTDSIEAMAAKGPRMREAIKNLLADVAEPWQEGQPEVTPVAEFPTAAPQPTGTPQPMATESAFLPTPTNTMPPPTITPTLDIVKLATQNAAQVTAVPTMDMSIWNPSTPPPTPAK